MNEDEDSPAYYAKVICTLFVIVVLIAFTFELIRLVGER